MYCAFAAAFNAKVVSVQNIVMLQLLESVAGFLRKKMKLGFVEE